MKNKFLWTIISSFIVMIAVAANAQPPQGNFGPPMGPGPGGQTMMERWETLRIWKLTEFLDLNEEQAAKFFPALQNFRDSMDNLDSAEVSLQKDIIQEIQSGKVNQRFVDRQKKEMLNLREQRTELEQQFLNSLPEYLSPEQQARYLVFEQRFQQALKNLIQRRRMER